MARRKNASFTGSPLHGGGDGARELVEAFYAKINAAIPGRTPVPIPPPASVHPKHDSDSQIFMFADYAVRKFAPIALDAVGAKAQASKLRKLPEIVTSTEAKTGFYQAAGAIDVVRAAHDAGACALSAARGNEDAAAEHAADAACNAAELNPGATWAAVTEMLAAL
jgi:hypothetical protein